MIRWLRKLFQTACIHRLDEIDLPGEPQSDMNLCIANLYGNYVRCSRCAFVGWVSRDEYIQNLRDTGRLRG